MPEPDFDSVAGTFSDFQPPVSTEIRQADQALHPDGSALVAVIMKARGEPHVKPQVDHIVSMMIRDGALDGVVQGGSEMDALQALVAADFIVSYNQDGKSREELIRMTTERRRQFRRRLGFGQQRGAYNEDLAGGE
jgi:hypothetical protein